jgi:hypothetical protein
MGRCAGHGEHGRHAGMHVRAILFDPCVYLISSADGPVTGDEDINVVRHVLEQSQPHERSPSVRERLNAAYLAATNSS